ncbi:MAG TPA: cell division topological specificity factor MinE [Caulobacteraceae bacterium]|nr:cell division topological specificity factor MinE [Caulobacteraceae bacterium]
MNLIGLFTRRASAPQARERLQVLLAYERSGGGGQDLVALLQQEILAVIARRVPIDRDKVVVRLDPGETVSTLAIDIEVPQRALAAAS